MYRNIKLFCLIFVFLFMLFSGVVAGQELVVKHTIGLAEDDLILFRPIDITWADDGRAFVLNEGSCSITVFSPQWQNISSFGLRGEGPGEINNPSMLMVFQQELWVKEMTGAEIFDLQGLPLRNQPMSPQVSAILPHGQALIGLGTFAEGCGIRLDPSGKVLSYFGPQKPESFGIEDLMRNSGWVVLPQGENCCVLLSRFDGQAWEVAADDSYGSAIDLKLGRGSVGADFRSKMVISDVGSDPLGGYYVIHYTDAGGPGSLLHFNTDWQQDGSWKFGENMRPGIVRVGAAGEMILIAEKSSILYVCERPVRQ